jgi:hypothetical protein
MHFDAYFEISPARPWRSIPQLVHLNNTLVPNLVQSGNQNEWSGQRKLA